MTNKPTILIEAADGSVTEVFKYIQLPCGSVAEFDYDAGYGYRCTSCFAVNGSIGMPSKCKEEEEKYHILKALGGSEWDYINGGVKK